MRLENIEILARREYLQRVRSKAFWIGTVLFPLIAVSMTVLPSLFLARTRTSQQIVIIDETGRVAPELLHERPQPKSTNPLRGNRSGDEMERQVSRVAFVVETPQPDRKAQDESLAKRVLNKEVDAWIRITPGVLEDDPVEYHGRSVSNFMTQSTLERRLSDAVRRVRLADAGLDPDKIGDLSAPVNLKTIRVSKEGSRAEGGAGGFFAAYVLFFMLFLALLIWGQQVMNGVLEEKGTRVVEVLVSAVKPFELMMGKLAGICLVGLTQFAIWLLTLVLVTAPGVVAALGTMPDEFKLPSLSIGSALHFLLFFILGFMVYASFYAALGAAFNNLQEAQQVAGTLGFLFAVPAIVMPMVINSPSSTVSVVMSLIPLFTPVLMPLRIFVEMPPVWQVALGYLLTIGFLFLMVWFCSRIYRVGILMYGKKPTIPELLRWVRYS
jgi:ABC-2 type transport system permease protein